jgi:hypothetical protein
MPPAVYILAEKPAMSSSKRSGGSDCAEASVRKRVPTNVGKATMTASAHQGNNFI